MGTVEIVLRKEGRFRRVLAIKRLLPAYRDDETFREMFLDEARVAGLLRHPNVVSVIDVGEDEHGPYLVMEYVEGIPLSKVIRRAARQQIVVPLQIALRVVADVARGLHAAHELLSHDGTPLQLVHRDVTPQNILVSYAGEVRVADFGIAKAFGRSAKTSTGVLKGKLGYMSPEQLRFHEPDRRSDLFSLGVVLFEVLSSTKLYDGEGIDGARRILEEPPPDILEHRDDVPDEVVALLFDLMAKDPELRPQTADEVATRLDQVTAELVVDEGVQNLGDYLGDHFSEEREAAKATLDAAIDRAERRPVELPKATVVRERRTRSFAGWMTLAALPLVGLAGWWAAGFFKSAPEAEPANGPTAPPTAQTPSAPRPQPEMESATETPPSMVALAEEAAPPDPRTDRVRARAERARARARTTMEESPMMERDVVAPTMEGAPNWGWDRSMTMESP